MKDIILEADFSKQIKAAMAVTCDNCGKQLGESYPKGRKTMQAQLDMGEDDEGFPQYKDHHFCGEECLRQHLNKRSEKKA